MTSAKSAVVTGANKGIGREVARRLATDGFKVWLGARNAEHGARAARELRTEGLNVHWLKIDAERVKHFETPGRLNLVSKSR